MGQEMPSNPAEEPGVSDTNLHQPGPSCNMQNVPASDNSPDSSSTHYVPVSRMSPLPQKKKIEGRKKQKIRCEVGLSEIITGSPFKQKIENKRRHATKSKNV
jgi:hypothetical protein